MRSFNLEIVTPDGLAYEGSVSSLLVRTDDGDIQILAGHVDYMAALGTGRAKLVLEDGKELYASCSKGFITVSAGQVRLVAVTFEFAGDIDLDRAEQAKLKAEQLLAEAKDEKAELIARSKLRRAINRIKVAELK